MWWKIILFTVALQYFAKSSDVRSGDKYAYNQKLRTTAPFKAFYNKQETENPEVFETSYTIAGFEPKKRKNGYTIIDNDSKKKKAVDIKPVDDLKSTGSAYLTTNSPLIIDSEGRKMNDGFTSSFESLDNSFNLETSSTEQKHHSRIQIKQGPNGENYEYEYVYYYDDEDEALKNDSKKDLDETTEEKINNNTSNQQASASKMRNRYSSVYSEGNDSMVPAVQELNEISSEGRLTARSRNRPLVDEVSEERLPVNTRFPPRSRLITTTFAPSVGTVSHFLSNSEERSRSTLRRPSLELVDSASFKTHAGDASVSQYRDADNQHSRENAVVDKNSVVLGQISSHNNHIQNHESATTEGNIPDKTTEENKEYSVAPTSMDKVTFDLYAYLVSEDLKEQSTTESSDTVTEQVVTEITTQQEEELITVNPTTTPTVKETTTTEVTTTPISDGHNRFRLRAGSRPRGRISSTTTTTAEPKTTNSENKIKNRFASNGSRPAFGRGRTAASINTATSEESLPHNEETKSVGHVRTIGRKRFSTSARTTPMPGRATEKDALQKTVSATTQARTKPAFNVRTRGRHPLSSGTTNETQKVNEDEKKQNAEEPPVVLKANSSRLIGRPTVSKLYNSGKSKTTTGPDLNKEEFAGSEQESSEAKFLSETTTETSSLNKLRQRTRLQISAPKSNPSATYSLAANRRQNPLISRRKFPVKTSVDEEALNTMHEIEDNLEKMTRSDTKTESEQIDNEKTDRAEASSEIQKGLNGLLVGRRRLVGRKPGDI